MRNQTVAAGSPYAFPPRSRGPAAASCGGHLHALLNIALHSNAEVNDLFRRAAVEADAGRRPALYREAEERIVSDAPWILLGRANLSALRHPSIRGPMLEPLSHCRLDRLWRSE